MFVLFGVCLFSWKSLEVSQSERTCLSLPCPSNPDLCPVTFSSNVAHNFLYGWIYSMTPNPCQAPRTEFRIVTTMSPFPGPGPTRSAPGMPTLLPSPLLPGTGLGWLPGLLLTLEGWLSAWHRRDRFMTQIPAPWSCIH